MLTGHRDIDYKILNNLDDKTLVNFCLTSMQADEYCNDQTFWMNRIMVKFPYIPLEVLKEYKDDRSWSEYYIYLRKFKTPKDYKTGGRFDYLMILVEEGIPEEYHDTIIARVTRLGRVDMLKYLLSKGYRIQNINKKLTRAGSLDMIKFLIEMGADIRNNYQVLITQFLIYGWEYRSRNERLNIIKYLHDIGMNIHFDNEVVLRMATRYGHLDVVKYLVEQGANIHVNYDEPVRYAHKNGHMNVVNYLVSQGAADPRIY